MLRLYLFSGLITGLVGLLAASSSVTASLSGAEPPHYSDVKAFAPRPIQGTPTPTACTYSFTTAGATIVPGTDDIGNNCDTCVTEVAFPFPVYLYGQQFSLANVSSNGNLQFISADPQSFNECLPAPSLEAAIMPHWDDLLTDANPGCPGGGCGIFTGLMGTAPNRIFTIEWRAVLYSDPFQPVNFQVWFYEGQTRFDFVYGVVSREGSDATIGVQLDGANYLQYSCMTSSVAQSLTVQWVAESCPVPPTGTPMSTATPCAGC